MKSISNHIINLPSDLIEKCWGVYSQKYEAVENFLQDSTLINSSFPISKNIHSTGAFQMGNAELGEIPESKLKQFFYSDRTNKLVIKMQTRSVFRGIDYYVGMQDKSNADKIKLIFRRLNEIIDTLLSIDENSNLILFLALLDYLRNYLMIILYVIHQSSKELTNLDNIEFFYGKYIKLIHEVEEKYLQTLSLGKLVIIEEPSMFKDLLQVVNKYIKQLLPILSKNDKLSTNLIRKTRECDHPLKILTFAKRLSMEYLPRNTILIGLEYGGIELPFAVNAYRKMVGKSKLQTLSVNLSSYSVSNKAFVDYLEDAYSPQMSIELGNYTTALILDDSTTTGRTIEYLIKLLPQNITSIYLALVSFTNTNRFHHLARREHGGINPLVAGNAVTIFKSNYTQTYTKHSYADRRGVFDKNKSKINKMLHEHYSEYL